MHSISIRRLIGGGAICFGAGLLFSCLLPGFLLAFIEAAVLVTAGILLYADRNCCR